MSRHPARGPGVPPTLLVLGGIGSVQFGSALAHTLFDDVGAAGITLLRLVLAAGVLLVVVRPAVRTWTPAAWRAVVMLGVAMGGMNLVFYLSLRTVPLGIAVTVEFIGPLLLTLVQTRRLLDLVWTVLAGGGVALLGLDSSGGVAVQGLVLAFVAGLFWAGYILASARVGRELPGADGLAVALAVGSLLALPFGLSGASSVIERPELLLPALGVALLSSVVPYGLEMSALRRMPTRIFGVLMSLEPGAAALAGLIVLGQALDLRGGLALAMVSIASLGITLGHTRARPPEPTA